LTTIFAGRATMSHTSCCEYVGLFMGLGGPIQQCLQSLYQSTQSLADYVGHTDRHDMRSHLPFVAFNKQVSIGPVYIK